MAETRWDSSWRALEGDQDKAKHIWEHIQLISEESGWLLTLKAGCIQQQLVMSQRREECPFLEFKLQNTPLYFDRQFTTPEKISVF